MTYLFRDSVPALAVPSETRVGWIGTGVMGAPMCQHLQQAHYRVTIYTRNRSKASLVLAKGATWADSPAAVAEQSDFQPMCVKCTWESMACCPPRDQAWCWST